MFSGFSVGFSASKFRGSHKNQVRLDTRPLEALDDECQNLRGKLDLHKWRKFDKKVKVLDSELGWVDFCC